MRRFKLTLHDAWSLAIPYWRSEERWPARLLLGSVVVLNLGLVGVTVLLTYWQRAFYNSLETKDWHSFIALLFWWRSTPKDGLVPSFVLIAAVFVPVTVYALYLRQALQIRWRRWMTEKYLESWFADRAYYHIALTDQGTDNPDQRISEDIRLFVDNALILGLGLLRSVVALLSFIVLLWSRSDPIVIVGVTIHGYLVWAALLYSGLGTLLTHLIGRRLIPFHYVQQNVEADFRFSLMRFRENAEGIALYGGELDEKRERSKRFGLIAENWRMIMAVTVRLTFFTTGFDQIALVFPLAVTAPAYFAGRMQLGGIFQISNAFVQVQGALSWMVDNYAVLTEWFATVDRLAGFTASIAVARASVGGLSVIAGDGEGLGLAGLNLTLPEGRSLLRLAEARIAYGERVLIVGPSGSGKSTLFRAMAGIWPFGSGRITRPAGRLLFLPQRPYIPLGSLKRAVCYPMHEDEFSEEQVIVALQDVGLSHLTPRIGQTDAWEHRLSGGEQQRLALARALLLKPDWLFLDEATASLDPTAEEHLYQLLHERLPSSTLVSIAHRQTVAKFHDRTLHFENGQLRAG